MSKVKMPRLPKKDMPIFSDADVTRLLAACDTPRDRAVVMFLLDTGVRVSEFVALNVGDVDLRSGAVIVRQGKGQRDRTSYMSARTAKQLSRYLSARGELPSDAPLWVSARGSVRLGTSGVSQLLHRLRDLTGVAPCSAHMFRRYFAVKSLRNGMDVFHLQRLGGWSSIEAMKPYMVLADANLKEAHQKFGVVDSVFNL